MDIETLSLLRKILEAMPDTAVSDSLAAAERAETAQYAAEDAASSAAETLESIPEDYSELSGEVSDLKENLSELETDISNGNFPEMAVGSADQLISDGYVVENEPYQFRRSGGSASVGTRMEDVIVGGTVAWNQHCVSVPTNTKNGITYTNNGDGSYTVNGTASALSYNIVGDGNVPINHVTYMCGCPQGGSNGTYLMHDGNNWFFDTGNGALFKKTASTNVNCVIVIDNGYTAQNLKFIPQLFDLTAMFGTEIADYIYSLEQANQGDGVAFFRKFFPKDYYAYNAGELMSVSGLSEHKTCGKNLLAITPYGGKYNAETGADLKINTPMPCSISNDGTATMTTNEGWTGRLWATDRLPKGIYTWPYHHFDSNNIRLTCYITDENLNVLTVVFNQTVGGNYQAREIEVEAGNRIAIYFGCNAAGTYNITDFYIPLESSYGYEPYKGHSYPLDDSLTLRGIPKLDSNNQLYFDGDRYLANGVVERKYGIVDLGTLNWIYSSADTRFYTTQIPVKSYVDDTKVVNAICDKYQITQYRYINGSYDNNMVAGAITVGGTTYFAFKNTVYTDAATFKTAMSGVMLVYELATPTTEQADPYHNPQIVDPEGTEEYVSTSLVPVGHETKYFEDLKGKLENLPSNFSTLIAPTEATYTATRNYTTGELLIVKNILYKVTSNIANGGTITPNTNVLATTLSEVIASLS